MNKKQPKRRKKKLSNFAFKNCDGVEYEGLYTKPIHITMEMQMVLVVLQNMKNLKYISIPT